MKEVSRLEITNGRRSKDHRLTVAPQHHYLWHPDSVEDFQEEPFRLIICNRYWQLWQSESVEDLSCAWLDCVQGNERQWRVLGPLRLDSIGDTSLMIHYAADKKPRGVLIDWDHVDLEVEIPQPALISLQPFSAIDVISGKPWGHLFRYDLESFVYILVWAAVHYDLRAKRRTTQVHRSLIKWVTGSLSDRVEAKQAFVMIKDGPTRDNIYDAVSEDFEHIMDSVIEPLLDLFSEGYGGRPSSRKKAPNAGYDYETCGGHITFKAFMKRIDGIPPSSRKEHHNVTIQ